MTAPVVAIGELARADPVALNVDTTATVAADDLGVRAVGDTRAGQLQDTQAAADAVELDESRVRIARGMLVREDLREHIGV